MTVEVECRAGPLDGLVFKTSLLSQRFLWVSGRGRAFRQPRRSTHLYRRGDRRDGVMLLDYVGHTHTLCGGCGVFGKRGPSRRCGLCNGVLV